MVDVCGLRDIPCSRYEFTYNNRRELDQNVQCWLDRALVTACWLDVFVDAHL